MKWKHKLNYEVVKAEDSQWSKRELRLSVEEWDFLATLSRKWFGPNARGTVRWGLARLIDEIRIALAPPPADKISRRRVLMRDEDWSLVLQLKDTLEFDTPSAVVRGLIYLLEGAPDYLFVHPHDVPVDWDKEERESQRTLFWARRILNHIKKKSGKTRQDKKKLEELWHTCKNPRRRKPLSTLKIKEIRSREVVQRELRRNDMQHREDNCGPQEAR